MPDAEIRKQIVYIKKEYEMRDLLFLNFDHIFSIV